MRIKRGKSPRIPCGFSSKISAVPTPHFRADCELFPHIDFDWEACFGYGVYHPVLIVIVVER